ncbi:MAG: MoaD/ThiS family protein [Theionarchaea archaeon]|nr:MoaD/ThiS family protein [Theionarchaea archaeon]
MYIHVKYFGVLRQRTGKKEEYVEREVETVGDVIQSLRNDYGLEPGFLVAINRKIVSSTERLSEGDEVAVFPPVVGG